MKYLEIKHRKQNKEYRLQNPIHCIPLSENQTPKTECQTPHPIKLFFILCSFFIVLSSPLLAQNDKAGTTGFAFLKMNYSARAMGIGNAFTGLANDGDAVFFNPAGLVQAENKQLKSTFMNYIEGLNGGSVVYVAEYNDWKLAPFVQFMVSDAIDRTILGSDGKTIDVIGSFHTSDIVLGVSLAKHISEALDIGLNAKYYYQQLDSETATVIAGDFSIMHHTQNENLKIGATLKNFGTQLTYFTDSNYDEKLPMMAIGGASYNLYDKATINADACFPFDNDFFFRAGAEYEINNIFTLRAGYDSKGSDYKTDEDMGFASGIALGVGFKWDKYTVDYAISSMGGLGYVNQIAVSVQF